LSSKELIDIRKHVTYKITSTKINVTCYHCDIAVDCSAGDEHAKAKQNTAASSYYQQYALKLRFMPAIQMYQLTQHLYKNNRYPKLLQDQLNEFAKDFGHDW